jgi:hypothetical protein
MQLRRQVFGFDRMNASVSGLYDLQLSRFDFASRRPAGMTAEFPFIKILSQNFPRYVLWHKKGITAALNAKADIGNLPELDESLPKPSQDFKIEIRRAETPTF